MPKIKICLEQGEYDAVARLADILRVPPEAIVYGALNRLMLESKSPVVREEVVDVWSWHGENLPLWSDSAGSVHAYEGKGDDEPEPSHYI